MESESKRAPGITFNFLDINDKEATSALLRNIKYKTGYDNPVILNLALRHYYQKTIQEAGG